MNGKSNEKRLGAVFDFHLDDVAEIIGPKSIEWKRQHFTQAVFGSGEIVAASKPLADGVTLAPGIYFLIWQGLICYVGQARSIRTRVFGYVEKERRPIDRVAVICGIPKWAQTELEHAYIHGWQPPWNAETKRSGYLYLLPELLDAVTSADRSHVMPSYMPIMKTCSSALSWPLWRQQVLGRLQFLRGTGAGMRPMKRPRSLQPFHCSGNAG